MSDPFFRPWVDKENVPAAPAPPPEEPHVNEQQQQQHDQNELIIEPSGSQQRAPTQQATVENGNSENKFASKENNQNTINTPEPPPAHISQPTSKASDETASTSAASASSVPFSLVTERQHLISPLPSQRATTHSGYTNSLPLPYIPKKKLASLMSSPLEAASVPVQTSEATKPFNTTAVPENNRSDERFATNSSAQSQPNISPTTSGSAQPQNQNSMNINPLGFQQLFEISVNQAQPTPSQYMQPCVTVGMSTSATARQYVPTPTPSQSFTTTERYQNRTDAQPQTSSQSAVGSPLHQRTTATSVLTQTSHAAYGHHLTSAPQVNSNSITRPQTCASQSSLATNGQHSTAPPIIQNFPTGGGRDTNFLAQLHMNQGPNQLNAPATHPVAQTISSQISMPTQGYDTNSLPQLTTNQASEQRVPAAKPIFESNLSEKMDVEDEDEEIRLNFQLPESAVSSPLDKSASTSALTPDAGYDSNSLSQASNQLSITDTKTFSDTVPTEQDENSWTDIESSESDTSDNTNGLHSTPPSSSQSSITVEASNAVSLPQPQFQQISVQPSDLAGIPITKTDSTDSDIENEYPQENIQIIPNREAKSPTPHTSKRPIQSAESSPLAQNSAAVVRTETIHGQHSPPRCSKKANNNNTSPLAEPQRRRSARQSTRNSTKQSTQESTKQSTKRPKKQTTQQPENQSTGSPPPLIPTNGMGCNLLFPNKRERTWCTLFYGMNRSPLIRSIILATKPGNVPLLTIDQWQQGRVECSPTKNQN
ncbi:putative GPI-anchored protein pfl2 [Ceratitis capitata]|uniref:putative GPI-anchored protein pfl2 n=1 Tax=Ceratitis capitata TaxID=7213 RepID=UPI00032A2820|nr:putative GPI-anchored protein pfl2 [Ceratitis capitata]